MQSAFADHNLKVALVLARQHGWPVDYIYSEKSCKFVLVLPVTSLLDLNEKLSIRPKEEVKVIEVAEKKEEEK